MATIFAHGLAATTLCYCAHKDPPKWVLTRSMIYCSIIPDLDVFGFGFGISYGEFWGHRGFTHSIVFAALIGSAVAMVLKLRLGLSNQKTSFWAFLLFLATVSHPFLDALTNGGLGVAAFSPFDDSRYFFPWRFLEVSPIGGAFISYRGLVVLVNETIFIGIPCLALLLGRFFLARVRNSKQTQ